MLRDPPQRSLTLEAIQVEDTLKPADSGRTIVFLMLTALFLISLYTRPVPTPAAQSTPAAVRPAPAASPLAPIWHSASTNHDYRVQVTNDLFRAEWVNIPAVSAKQGAYIRTECRRAGLKWVGSSSIKMLFAVPGAPPGQDTKLCSITVRFEVDSLTPQKIAGHSEALHPQDFDVKSCRVLKTTWGEFTWIPKK